MSDPVNNPKHYNSHPTMECIELVELLPFCEGNACKYLWRSGLKGSAVEDLRKALWYVERAQNSEEALRVPYHNRLRQTVQRAIDGFAGDRRGLAIRAIALSLFDSARDHIQILIAEAKEEASVLTP